MKYIIISILFLISVPYLFSFGGGNGSEFSPFEIHTKAHLELLADSVNNSASYPTDNWSKDKYFKVMNNITEPVTTFIGTASRPFQGNFDGQNYTITLAIDMPAEYYVGLFGYMRSATIKNVIVNGYVNASDRVGGIAGYASGSSISNCINTGSVSGNNTVGGIAGCGYNASISNCMNIGNISGDDYVGGIAGEFYTSISNCMNIGNISGKGHVGGINGSSPLLSITTYCVNYGFVKGIDSGVGGINGHLYDTIENCINTGIVEGEDASVTGPIQGAP
ncbi:MAG: hypothetical protein FWG85_03785 [Bacteroidetes bacterium]|nr:hypothetical protein [Bacteroidota bacterium]